MGIPGINLLDFLDHVEVKTLLALEFVGAVAGADGGRQRIATGPLHEFDRFLRIRERGMAFVHLDVLFDPAQLPELGFDADAFGVRAIHHALCDRDVFLKRLVARVDHDGTVKPRGDAIVAGLLVSVIEMDGKNDRRETSPSAVRIIASSILLSAYFRAPFES